MNINWNPLSSICRRKGHNWSKSIFNGQVSCTRCGRTIPISRYRLQNQILRDVRENSAEGDATE